MSTSIVFIFSCSTVSYISKITLEVSPKTINKVVLIQKIFDQSAAKLKRNPLLGFSVTNEKILVNGLELAVTNEIAADFYNQNNELINSYTGKSQGRDIGSLCKNNSFSVKSLTNKAFGLAIQKI
ncbi:MAG: hypothetical protein VW080_02205 [Flavobacteriaceae bacterium]